MTGYQLSITYLWKTSLNLRDKQAMSIVYWADIDDQDVSLPSHPVLVHQLAHQLLALIYLVEVKLLHVKLLIDKQHALWWPPIIYPVGLEHGQVLQLALHHPLFVGVRVVPE